VIPRRRIEPNEYGQMENKRFDISKIDFDLLLLEFSRARRKKLILKDLKELIEEQLEDMLFANAGRILISGIRTSPPTIMPSRIGPRLKRRSWS